MGGVLACKRRKALGLPGTVQRRVRVQDRGGHIVDAALEAQLG